MPVVGHQVTLQRTLTAADEDAFLALSTDPNPLHRDDAFAQAHGHGARIAHGLLVTSFCLPAIAAALGTDGFMCLTQSVRFNRPVMLGDALQLRASITHVTPALRLAVVAYEVQVAGTIVLTGEVHTKLLGSSES
jgi:acyl dehydratase